MARVMAMCHKCRQKYNVDTYEGHSETCPFFKKDADEVEIL